MLCRAVSSATFRVVALLNAKAWSQTCTEHPFYCLLLLRNGCSCAAYVAAQTFPMSYTQAEQAPALANVTLAKITEAIGEEAAAPWSADDAYKRLGYCSVLLKQRCSEKLSV